MNAAAVLVGCLVALASTEPSTEPPQEKEVIKWIMNIIKFDTELLPTTAKPQEPKGKCPICRCGIAHTRSRIIGGSETKVLEFPWMALVTLKDGTICGGSLINDLYVLTAAHCVFGFNKDHLSVRLLEHDRSDVNETKHIINRKVAAIIAHSHYDPSDRTRDNDMALLRLDKKVCLMDSMKRSHNGNKLPGVRTICLPPEGRTFEKVVAMVLGWGKTFEDGDYSDKLMEVTIPIMSNEDCRKTEYGAGITNNMMCAGEPEGRHDACKGDSGGPLQVLNHKTGSHMVVGVVSWGFGCARPNLPGVYARVNRYLLWLKRNTRDACYCSEQD